MARVNVSIGSSVKNVGSSWSGRGGEAYKSTARGPVDKDGERGGSREKQAKAPNLVLHPDDNHDLRHVVLCDELHEPDECLAGLLIRRKHSHTSVIAK